MLDAGGTRLADHPVKSVVIAVLGGDREIDDALGGIGVFNISPAAHHHDLVLVGGGRLAAGLRGWVSPWLGQNRKGQL